MDIFNCARCNETVAKQETQYHLEVCSHSLFKCTSCKQQIAFREIRAHMCHIPTVVITINEEGGEQVEMGHMSSRAPRPAEQEIRNRRPQLERGNSQGRDEATIEEEQARREEVRQEEARQEEARQEEARREEARREGEARREASRKEQERQEKERLAKARDFNFNDFTPSFLTVIMLWGTGCVSQAKDTMTSEQGKYYMEWLTIVWAILVCFSVSVPRCFFSPNPRSTSRWGRRMSSLLNQSSRLSFVTTLAGIIVSPLPSMLKVTRMDGLLAKLEYGGWFPFGVYILFFFVIFYELNKRDKEYVNASSSSQVTPAPQSEP
ncbi:hypothetical protein GCK72_008922 [Caenorhabditis remanei]|uniref:Uncharacterized protein n=1 Tax=Caenorhabditis remanei TaxID=31234 RepID=A0A6A5H254_CAERE|nr:hypothetical protein GCK72_008922 [Caenorhabditis remanei]KAF1760673.1 hypothetical protein GCK72_008922 [Caenorhabditis remanei]